MPKPILLVMTTRHLTESGEVITSIEIGEVLTIMYRYAYGQSYSKYLELEPCVTLYIFLGLFCLLIYPPITMLFCICVWTTQI